MEVPLNGEITYFGKTNFRGTNQVFGIKRKDRRQHMYVLGKSGTGKSVLLSNMIVQNIKNGEGVCVVDPHGELVEEILHSIPPERVKDVIYFNPADTDYHIGFNVLQLDDPRYKHLVASGLMGIFTKIWANAWSSRMEYILNNAILALLDTPGTTLLGIPRLLVDKDYRQVIINNLKDPVVKAFWIHEYEAWRDQFRNEAIAPIQNKVGQFLSTSIVRNVVGQSRSTIDIFDIMNSGKIFLVNVSKGRIGEDNSALLGGMIITKLQLAAMERVRIPEKDRKDFYLYVDEFQNFVTDSFAGILSEARKYRLNLTIAHQYIGQLVTESGTAVRDAVFGNVGTMIIFRVGAADADFLEKEFEPEFTPEDVVNQPNYHTYLKLMVDGITSRPFSAKTLPPIEIDHDANVGEQIIQSSRDIYTRPREVVENEISQWSGMGGTSSGAGAEMEGKFKATCSACGKTIFVPFEPEGGRPIYCKEDLLKIKNGEILPMEGFRPPREKNADNVSYDALSFLGIEFTGGKDGGSKTAQRVMDRVMHAQQDRTKRDDAPRAYQKPIEKKKGPDVLGLKSAISEALANTIGKKSVVPIKQEEKPAPVVPEPEKVPEKTMSLSDLKKENPHAPTPQNGFIQKKESSEEHKSALKNAILEATKSKMAGVAHTPVVSDTAPVVAPAAPVIDPKIEEEKKQAEVAQKKIIAEKEAAVLLAQKAEAEKKVAEEQAKKIAIEKAEAEAALEKAEAEKVRIEKEKAEIENARKIAAEEAERITLEKEKEFARKMAEEKARIEAENKAREAAHLKKLEEDKKSEETKDSVAHAKKKEVPENILRKILEE